MSTGDLPRLVGISPGDVRGQNLPGFIELACAVLDAGLPALLLREPGLNDRERLELASTLRARFPGAWLVIHDAAHLLPQGPFDAVHLGFRSLPVRTVRGILGASATIGFSAHAHDEPDSWQESDYLFASPVLETASKRGLIEPIGWQGLQAIAQRAKRPVYALGGLRAQHWQQVRRAGAHGIAVQGAIFGALDPLASVRELLQATRGAG